MLSRLAENLFWMGRYIERAEDTALMLDVTYHGLLESSPAEAGLAWWGLLEVLHLDQAYRDRFGDEGEATGSRVTKFLVLDAENKGSITSSVERTRENARSVRELVSTELWQAINTFYLDLRARDLRRELERNPHDVYGMVKLSCQTIYGVASETMPRDDGWRFMMLGRMLERAEMTCRLLNVRYAQLTANPHAGFHDWMTVLKSASAFEAYRKSYKASMNPGQVVEFLLFSEDFPRSVLFCLRTAENGLAKLGPAAVSGGPLLTRPRRLLGRIRAELEYRDLEDLMSEGLQPFLDRVQEEVWAVADAVADQFFRAELRSDHPLQPMRTA
jgi:uncharacterized alpha-E superfamily protein